MVGNNALGIFVGFATHTAGKSTAQFIASIYNADTNSLPALTLDEEQ
jgi:hypothetical protein